MIAKSGMGEKHYSLIHVDDLVAMIIDVAERGARVDEAGTSGVYFCADGVDYTWEALARGALAALGRRGTVVPIPEVITWLAAGASSAAAATDRAPRHPLPRQDDGDSRAGVDLLLRQGEAGTRVDASRVLRRRDEGFRQVVPGARPRLTETRHPLGAPSESPRTRLQSSWRIRRTGVGPGRAGGGARAGQS